MSTQKPIVAVRNKVPGMLFRSIMIALDRMLFMAIWTLELIAKLISKRTKTLLKLPSVEGNFNLINLNYNQCRTN